MNNPVQEIKEKLDIVDIVREYIPLMPAGKNFKAPCPFHKEKTPSFMVSQERQNWHCFGSCNEGGDIFSFVMKYENIEFYEALKMLAEKAGIELKKISPSHQKEFGVLYDINNAAKDFFISQLGSDQRAGEYINSRGLKKETLEEFEIGYAPGSSDALAIHLVNLGYEMSDVERAGLIFKNDNKVYMDRFRGRIMFPLYNTFSKVVGFSGRILPQFENDMTGKYVNSPETLIFNKSKILYGFHKTKSWMKSENQALLVEGQMDFLMLYQDGVKNGVAVSGTALTNYHLEIIKKLSDNLVIGFDNDAAGNSATKRAIDMAHTLDFNVSVFALSEAKDAAEYIQKNPGKIKLLISQNNISALEFYFREFINPKDGNLKNQTRKILEKIALIFSPIEQNSWMKKLSERIGIGEKFLEEELVVMKKSKNSAKAPEVREVVDKKEDILLTRIDRLAYEIILFALMDKNNLSILDEYKSYFPEKFVKILDSFENKSPLFEDLAILAEELDMKSSLKSGSVDREKLSLEINFLLKELKKEFYRERKAQLFSQIKEKEKENNTEAVSLLLKEFDEVAKLVDN